MKSPKKEFIQALLSGDTKRTDEAIKKYDKLKLRRKINFDKDLLISSEGKVNGLPRTKCSGRTVRELQVFPSEEGNQPLAPLNDLKR